MAGIGGDFLAAVTRRSRASTSGGNVSGGGGGGGGGGGLHGHRDPLATGASGGRVQGSGEASGANFSSDAGVVRGASEECAARGRGSDSSGGNPIPITAGGRHPSWWQEDHEQEILLSRRDFFGSTVASAAAASGKTAGAALETAAASRREAEQTATAASFARRWEGGGGAGPASIVASNRHGRFSEGGSGVGGTDSRAGPREIADEALASLRTGGSSASGIASAAAANGFGRDSGLRDGDRAVSSSAAAAAPGAANERGRQARVHPPSTSDAEKATTPADRTRPVVSGGVGGGPGDNDYGARMAPADNSGKHGALPPPPPPPLKAAPVSAEPAHAAYASRSPTGIPAVGYRFAGLNGHGVVERGGQADGTVAGRTLARGGSWGVGAARGVNGTALFHGDGVGEGVGRGGAGEPFRSASWAEKLVTKREEQVGGGTGTRAGAGGGHPWPSPVARFRRVLRFLKPSPTLAGMFFLFWPTRTVEKQPKTTCLSLPRGAEYRRC